MVGFDLGLALQQTSTLHVPRRGPSFHGLKFWLRCSIFFSFLLAGFSTLLIKAEIQDLKDVQIWLPSSLTKPWLSWYFKKLMEGLRFHVSHKMCWFHKYRKVKHDLSAVFTFLQCLQKEEKWDVKVCIQQCEAELSLWLPWWEYMTPRTTMVCLLSANKAFRSSLLTRAALLRKYWLLFLQMCVKGKKQKIGLNKIGQELRKRWEAVYCNLSFIIFLCIF